MAAAVILVAALATWLILRSSRFQRYALRTAQEQASQAVGVGVHISRLQFHFHSLSPSVDVYGIQIDGRSVPGMQSSEQLLRLPHARVQVGITSLLHRRWHLENVTLDHPVVHVLINDRGETNLPTGPRQASSSRGPDIFALGIRHAAVHSGEVYINNKAQSLSADLNGVELALAYRAAPQSYSGTLSYSQGRLQFAGIRPLTSSLALQFLASRQGVQVPSLVFSADGARVNAHAELTGYANPRLSAQYQLEADLGVLRTVLHQPAVPRGTVQVSGTADYAHGALSAEGTLSSSELREMAAAVDLPIRQLRGGFRFADGVLTISGLRAEVAGGHLTAGLALRHAHAAPTLQVQMQLQAARLGQLVRLAPNGAATLSQLGITGSVDVSASARGPLDLAALSASAQAAVHAQLGAVPLTGAVDADYKHGQVTFSKTSLNTPHAQITLAGTLSLSPATRLPVQLMLGAHSHDLGGLEATAGRLAAAFGHHLPALRLAGQGALTATVSGSLASPQINGEFSAAPFSVRGAHWSSLRGQFEASSDRAALRQVALRAGSAQIQLNASLGLKQWRALPDGALSAAASIHGLPLDALAPLLPARLPVTGILNVEAQVQGTLGAPTGQGAVTVSPVRLIGKLQVGLESVRVSVHGDKSALTAQLTAQLMSGQIVASGTFHPSTGVYTAQLDAPTLDLAKSPPLKASQTGIHGTLALHGSGAGALAAPEFQLQVTSSHLAVDGQAIQGFEAHVILQGQHLQATVAAAALQSALHAQAQVTLAGNWPASVSLEVPPGPVTPLLAAFAPDVAADLQGQVALRATLSGPLRDPRQLQATILLPTFNLEYAHVVAVHATAPLEALISNGVVQVKPAHLVGPNTDFQLQGSVPVPALGAAENAPLQLTLAGTVNLKLAEALALGLSAGGKAAIHIITGGTLAHPSAEGSIQVSNASVSSLDWPVGLQNGHGALRLHDGRMDLVGFTGSVGGGNVTLSGGMAFTPKAQFNLSVAAREVRVRYPAGLRETVSADVNLTGSPAAALLSGRARVEDVSPMPGFDFATLTAQLSQHSVVVSTPGSFLAGLRLEVAVTTPNEIAINSRDFSLHANANVNVRGTADVPVVLGRVDLTSGDLIFRGNRYVIQSGTLDFVNPIRTVPTVNVTADATIQQYNLHLHFQGSVDNLRTAYTSDPALPPADIISLLAFGQTTEAGATNSLPGNLGAETMVAGAVTGQITDRVEKIAGISHLSVDPILGGGQQNAGARITIQQRVTGNLYVTISTDVTSTERNVIEVQYHLSPRVSISGVRKQNGGFGANLQFKKVWH